MNTLESMQVFMRVAEQASFTRAAESLGLLKATVSQSVQQLENSLGTRLLHRTTRKVQMTLDGQAYYDRCKELLADVERADHVSAVVMTWPSSVICTLRVVRWRSRVPREFSSC